MQIRGHRVRLPLDIVLVATANPEDYTNRGRIITPLKDRFGAQIRTHYPPDAATELRIAELEADLPGRGEGRPRARSGAPSVEVPGFMAEIVAELSQLARQSPHLNQRSGVSVRLTIANYETLVANATRRALRNGESEAVPRISDLQSLISSTQGKVEIESLEEGRDEVILSQLAQRRRAPGVPPPGPPGRAPGRWSASFTEDTVVHAGDDLAASAYAETFELVPALSAPVLALTGGSEDPAMVASATEFILEGLHLTKRLNKEAAGARATYRGRG